MNKNVELLRKISKQAEEQIYPGYPFQLTGTIDFGCEKAFFNSYGEELDLDTFLEKFGNIMAYQMVDSKFTQKGNWLCDTKMAEYKKIISFDTKYNDFYIDNVLAVKLYLGLWSAIREYKGTKALLWFIIDMDCEYVDIQVFQTKKEIELYMKDIDIQ